jgi:hypothetical protein
VHFFQVENQNLKLKKSVQKWVVKFEELLAERAYLRQLESTKKTAPISNEPLGTIKIINPIHPLYGVELTVRKVRKLSSGSTALIVIHVDGGLLYIAAEDTSYSVQCEFEKPRQIGPFSQNKLITLLKKMQSLKALQEQSLEIDSSDQAPGRVASEQAKRRKESDHQP